MKRKSKKQKGNSFIFWRKEKHSEGDYSLVDWATPTAKYNWRTQPALNAAIDFTE